MVAVRSLGIGVIGFLLGVLVMALLVQNAGQSARPVVIADTPRPAETGVAEAITAAPAPIACEDAARRIRTAGPRTPPSQRDAMAYLRDRGLHLPVAGIAAKDLHQSFDAKRGGSRLHEAIDILAPRHTRVEAVDDGCVARLFESRAGGITLYQFDPTLTYTYYYAHLEGYADDIEEGEPVRRGQVIGYVGTTGNAPPNTPHLHFAIFIMGAEKRWWEGTPIDPYEVWSGDPLDLD
jgi:murein DD-endopeptidase MepM/ murein hydrolase activator NlpD